MRTALLANFFKYGFAIKQFAAINFRIGNGKNFG